MFQAKKIEAHIKLLENRRIRIQSYLDAVKNSLPERQLEISMSDRKRVADIETSLNRINQQISSYQGKLAHIQSLER